MSKFRVYKSHALDYDGYDIQITTNIPSMAICIKLPGGTGPIEEARNIRRAKKDIAIALFNSLCEGEELFEDGTEE